MKKIKLSQNKYTLVDNQDFDYLNHWKWCLGSGGYAIRTEYNPKRTIYMHRILFTVQTLFGDKLDIDHINRNKLDNRRSNLRLATRSQNQFNRSATKRSSTGIKGVFWYKRKKKWISQIRINRVLKHLGYFDNIKDAELAYQKASYLNG